MKSREPRFWNATIVGALLIAVAALAPQPAFAQLEWRVSVKFILDPLGNRPGYENTTNCAEQNSPEKILTHYEYANRMLASYGRGYRFEVTEFVDVTGLEPFFNASSDGGTRVAIENIVTADPDTYAFRDDAINIYILNTCEGGYSSRPPGVVTIVGQRRRGAIVRPIHEIGHFFGLCHTHGGGPCETWGCGLNPCPQAENGCDPSEIGDDCVVDTLPDNCCWENRNTVSIRNLGVPYDALPNEPTRQLVDNTWFNIMSYHLDHDNTDADPNGPNDPSDPNDPNGPTGPNGLNQMRRILTPDQLDIVTDLSNNERFSVTTGLTHFVDAAATGPGDGSSADPYPTLIGGIAAAGQSGTTDIILLRAGGYNESVVIGFPVCLRATRGAAVIGQ